MESSCTYILYQTQLFAEGLECVLRMNAFNVCKKSLTEVKELRSIELKKIGILIIEANWPFPRLENILDELAKLSEFNTKMLLITNIVNKSLYRLVCKNKIHAIVLKRSSMDELLFGIKQVLGGETYYSSLAASVFLKNNMESQIVKVSKREKQILSLLADLKTTKEIANNLSITKSTVKTHRRNLMRKFNTKNILSLLRLACRENLLNEESDFCGCCYKQFVGI